MAEKKSSNQAQKLHATEKKPSEAGRETQSLLIKHRNVMQEMNYEREREREGSGMTGRERAHRASSMKTTCKKRTMSAHSPLSPPVQTYLDTTRAQAHRAYTIYMIHLLATMKPS